MNKLKIEIVAKRNDDNTGTVRWEHKAEDGNRYGDGVELKDFDKEILDALGVVADNALLVMQHMYFQQVF